MTQPHQNGRFAMIVLQTLMTRLQLDAKLSPEAMQIVDQTRERLTDDILEGKALPQKSWVAVANSGHAQIVDFDR